MFVAYYYKETDNMFNKDQFEALCARVDNLQQCGLQVQAVEIHQGLDNEMVVSIATTGVSKFSLPDSYGTRFIISEQANIRSTYLPGGRAL